MKSFRLLFAWITVCLLGAGYALSQISYFSGWAPLYAERVDSPSIRMLALLVLGVAVALGFVPDRTLAEESEAEEVTA